MMVGGLNNNEYIRTLIISLWGDVGSRFAREFNEMIDNIGKDDIMWEEMMRNYMFERSAMKAGKILSTQQAEINRIIDVVNAKGLREGWSIDKISLEITKHLKNDLVKIQAYHAERIARTEVIGASNKGSFDAARMSGLEMQKAWSTSGLSGVRDSHMYYESLGFVSMDYEYAPGLKFPGDATGSPDEIINCRCAPLWSVD